MTTIHATAPCRVDLAGGTLDLWPLGVLVAGSVTVNVAIDILTGCSITPRDAGFELAARGVAAVTRLERLPARPEGVVPPAHALAALVASHFNLPPCRIETWSDAPRGSGLGASSSLCMALIGAATQLVGRRLTDREAVEIACNLETRLLDLPAGTQDHWAGWCGGAAALEHGMEGTHRTSLDPRLGGLAPLFVVADTGVSHHSGQNNWTVFRGALERAPGVREALADVAAATRDLRDALVADSSVDARLRGVGAAMGAEWAARRALSPAVSCPEIELLSAAAANVGGVLKACGAGGGGCVVALPGTVGGRADLVQALSLAGGRVLAVSPVGRGVEVHA